MDIFFFCSGCLLKGLDMENGIRSGFEIFHKKVIRLIIPYIIWTFIIFCADNKPFVLDNLLEYFIYRPKYGLWFLQDMMLYCLFVIGAFIVFRYIPEKFRRLVEIFSIVAIMIMTAYLGRSHLFFFLLGILFVRNFYILDIITKKWISHIASIILLASILINEIPSMIVGFSSIVVMYNIGRHYSLPKIMTDAIVLFGKYSMPIFLVHFFIVQNIQISLSTHPFALFAITILIAILISYFCIALYKLSLVGALPTLLWGEKIKK